MMRAAGYERIINYDWSNLNQAFDAYPTHETHSVFLDMSKTFGKVWHKGLYNI